MKDRHSVGFRPLKYKACCRHVKGSVSVDLWRQYFKKGFLCFSVAFLLVVMLKPGWLPRYSDSETVQLVTPLTHRGHFYTGNGAIYSGSILNTRTMMMLKEEAFTQPRPRDGTKEAHEGILATHQNFNSGDRNGFMNPLGLSKDIKIYIYDLPSSFNVDWLKDDRCSKHLFAAEVAIHQRLLSSPIRTLEPLEADYFYIPVYVSCNFNTTTGFPAVGHARSLFGSAVKYVSRKMTHWNRTGGKDHIIVATHDFGPCFHTMEDMAVNAGIPDFLHNSVILQTFGQTGKHACQTSNSIIIPPFVSPQFVKQNFSPQLQRRSIWVHFRGKIELHPKIASGPVYSRGIRSILWQKFRRAHRFYIRRNRSPNYQLEIQRSVFCLCPLGWAPWSPRIVESIISGCIPVIIADKIALPYSNVINWPKISITVSEKDIFKLGRILDKVSRTNLSLIQENLWDIKHRKALLYVDPLTVGDATWQILDLLSRKVGRQRVALPNATSTTMSE